MIKRISKLTALMMVAGTTISIIPTTSAHAAVALETLNGTMNSVQAFDNGKYLFDGYKDAKVDTEIYFFDGTKDIALDDLDGEYSKYGETYVDFSQDNSLVDLSTGEVLNESALDKREVLETKLKNKVVNKADRYSDTKNLKYIKTIDNNKFAEEWFEYKVTNDDESKSYILFVNESGKYIDSSEDLNITHYLKDGTKVEINTAEDLQSKGYSAVFGNALFSDEDYIYRAIRIVNNTDSSDSETYIQKISKQEGKMKDEAYLPKDVKSYSIEGMNILTSDLNKDTGMRIISDADNETVYFIKAENSQMTIKKYDFLKERDFSSNAVTNDRVYKLVEDTDYKGIKDENVDAYDIDNDNNIWILNKGKIEKFDGNKLEVMYTVDRSMNSISAYDENDIVVWNSKEGIYSTVGGTTLRVGWTKYPDGSWSYLKEDGSKTTGWIQDGGKSYYLNKDGIMHTGWLFDNNNWYYLNSDGSMKTGLFNDGTHTYYLDDKGQMQNNGWAEINSTKYYFNEDGSAKTGWFLDDDLWYYFNQSGELLTNTVVDGYKIGRKGFWVK